MSFILPPKIAAYLNNGEVVIAEIPHEISSHRCFVRIEPWPNPEVPREERRYLNSRYSMWEYWHFRFQRVVLRPGWQDYPDDWDHYLVEQARLTTHSESEFYEAAEKLIGDAVSLKHHFDSDCPI